MTNPFYQLLSTRYDDSRELEAIEILSNHPNLAVEKWIEEGNEFIYGSTALHYAANDGKIRLIEKLLELGADVNANEAHWFATPLSWAANNAQLQAAELLLSSGADPKGLHVMHAIAFGGSSCGKDQPEEYLKCAKLLINAGADKDDTREPKGRTPYQIALDVGNTTIAQYLAGIGAN